jgi:hypothetical protein
LQANKNALSQPRASNKHFALFKSDQNKIKKPKKNVWYDNRGGKWSSEEEYKLYVKSAEAWKQKYGKKEEKAAETKEEKIQQAIEAIKQEEAPVEAAEAEPEYDPDVGLPPAEGQGFFSWLFSGNAPVAQI